MNLVDLYDRPMVCTCGWVGAFRDTQESGGQHVCPQDQKPVRPMAFGKIVSLKEAVVGLDQTHGGQTVITKFNRGNPMIMEGQWEASRQLVDGDLKDLPGGTRVLIIWPGGGGPWAYEIRKIAGRAFAGNASYPIGNVGTVYGQHTIIWELA